MKKLIYIAAFASLSLLTLPAKSQVTAVSYDVFYNQLSPHGRWVTYQSYGSVWQPSGIRGFRPYETNGHWVATESGWAWASDYDWGWAPFHYGRWVYDPAMGWLWVPGYQWAPAWVTWGQYDDYYAWAPLSPGVSISWIAPYNYWSFAPHRCIGYRNINRYIYRPARPQVIVKNITVINNYNTYNNVSYHQGPRFKDVERYTKQTIHPVIVESAEKPGATAVKTKAFVTYKPQPEKAGNPAASSEPAPKPKRDMSGDVPLKDQPKMEVAEPSPKQSPRQPKQGQANQSESIDEPRGNAVVPPQKAATGVPATVPPKKADLSSQPVREENAEEVKPGNNGGIKSQTVPNSPAKGEEQVRKEASEIKHAPGKSTITAGGRDEQQPIQPPAIQKPQPVRSEQVQQPPQPRNNPVMKPQTQAPQRMQHVVTPQRNAAPQRIQRNVHAPVMRGRGRK